MEEHNIKKRDGEKLLQKHKKFVEKDFPIALTKFKIVAITNAITIENCLDKLKKHSEELNNLIKKINE
jgi:hypothetical protein